MASNLHQNASSFRRIPSPVNGSGGDRNSPPSLPFAMSPDNTATNSAGGSSALSSTSSSFSSNHQGGIALAGTGGTGSGSGDTTPSSSSKSKPSSHSHHLHRSRRKLAQDIHNRALSKKALMENDAMVYLDGPQVYTCANCRTHLTSHDDIISKSFHGRHGKCPFFSSPSQLCDCWVQFCLLCLHVRADLGYRLLCISFCLFPSHASFYPLLTP